MCPADATLEGKRADPTHQQNAALLPAKRRARECIGRAAAVQKTQRSRGQTGLGRAHSLDIQAEAPHVARRGECVDTPRSVGYGQTAAIARVESENIHWLQSGAKEETCQAAPRDQNGTERPESLVGCMAGVLRGGSHAQQVDDCLMPRLQSVEEWRTPLFVHGSLVGHSLEKVSEPSRHRIQSHPQTRARAHATRSLALQWRGTGSALDEILMPLCSGDVQRCAPILTEPDSSPSSTLPAAPV